MKPATRAALLLTPASLVFFGANTYQKPPKEIMDILNAPTTPTLSLGRRRAMPCREARSVTRPLPN